MERHNGVRSLLVLVGAMALASGHALGAASSAVDPLESAKAAIRVKEYGRAAGDLEREAAKGNKEAQYLLGTFALNGLVTDRDVAKARMWFEKAATNGHARAA